jgi:thioredoxin 2
MPSSDYQIIPCHQCGVNNRIPSEKLSSPLTKCGRCGASLSDFATKFQSAVDYKLRCGHCKTLNRIPSDKLYHNPKCGKCGHLVDTADILSGRPVVVTDTNFPEKVLASPLPVLMYAWAPWCGSCQSVNPIIDQFAAESIGKVRVTKLNLDSNPSLANRFNILSVPFLFFFDRGELKERMAGTTNKHDIMLKMAQYL